MTDPRAPRRRLTPPFPGQCHPCPGQCHPDLPSANAAARPTLRPCPLQARLRKGVNILLATPGRLHDHLINTKVGFCLSPPPAHAAELCVHHIACLTPRRTLSASTAVGCSLHWDVYMSGVFSPGVCVGVAF